MKVYVATIVFYYEEGEIVGVFDTKEKAERAAETSRRRIDSRGLPYLRVDEINVSEWEVE